jgi:hypothetical protein
MTTQTYDQLKSIILAASADMPKVMRFCTRCGPRACTDESRRVYYCLECSHEDAIPPESTIQFFNVLDTIWKTNPHFLKEELGILKDLNWNSENNDLDHQSDETKQYLIGLLVK